MNCVHGLWAVRGPFGQHVVFKKDENGRWGECGRFWDNGKPRCFPNECFVSMRTVAGHAEAGFVLDGLVYVWGEEEIEAKDRAHSWPFGKAFLSGLRTKASACRAPHSRKEYPELGQTVEQGVDMCRMSRRNSRGSESD